MRVYTIICHAKTWSTFSNFKAYVLVWLYQNNNNNKIMKNIDKCILIFLGV